MRASSQLPCSISAVPFFVSRSPPLQEKQISEIIHNVIIWVRGDITTDNPALRQLNAFRYTQNPPLSIQSHSFSHCLALHSLSVSLKKLSIVLRNLNLDNKSLLRKVRDCFVPRNGAYFGFACLRFFHFPFLIVSQNRLMSRKNLQQSRKTPQDAYVASQKTDTIHSSLLHSSIHLYIKNTPKTVRRTAD